jgi:hypothetical protein
VEPRGGEEGRRAGEGGDLLTGTTSTESFTIKALGPDTWDAFADLAERHNGVWGGCWCTWFHTAYAEKDHNAEGSRALKDLGVKLRQGGSRAVAQIRQAMLGEADLLEGHGAAVAGG